MVWSRHLFPAVLPFFYSPYLFTLASVAWAEDSIQRVYSTEEALLDPNEPTEPGDSPTVEDEKEPSDSPIIEDEGKPEPEKEIALPNPSASVNGVSAPNPAIDHEGKVIGYADALAAILEGRESRFND